VRRALVGCVALAHEAYLQHQGRQGTAAGGSSWDWVHVLAQRSWHPGFAASPAFAAVMRESLPGLLAERDARMSAAASQAAPAWPSTPSAMPAPQLPGGSSQGNHHSSQQHAGLPCSSLQFTGSGGFQAEPGAEEHQEQAGRVGGGGWLRPGDSDIGVLEEAARAAAAGGSSGLAAAQPYDMLEGWRPEDAWAGPGLGAPRLGQGAPRAPRMLKRGGGAGPACSSTERMGCEALLAHLQRLPWYARQVVHVQHMPPRPPRYAVPASGLLSERVASALASAAGATQLYVHQVGAGRNVVLPDGLDNRASHVCACLHVVLILCCRNTGLASNHQLVRRLHISQAMHIFLSMSLFTLAAGRRH
jgi:hypothetical protein